MNYLKYKDSLKERNLIRGLNVKDYGSLSELVSIIGSDNTNIYLPSGTYEISSDLTIPSNVKLTFEIGAMLYRSNNAVATKGDGARIHFGIIAQKVEEIFISEGLNPEDYALFCKDVWYEHNGVKVQVNQYGEMIEIQNDENGNTVEIKYETTKKISYGIRYEELLCFILSAI